jgi:hypothetical protein
VGYRFAPEREGGAPGPDLELVDGPPVDVLDPALLTG